MDILLRGLVLLLNDHEVVLEISLKKWTYESEKMII